MIEPEDLPLKAELARQICKRIEAPGLTQAQAGIPGRPQIG